MIFEASADMGAVNLAQLLRCRFPAAGALAPAGRHSIGEIVEAGELRRRPYCRRNFVEKRGTPCSTVMNDIQGGDKSICCVSITQPGQFEFVPA